MVFCTKLTDRSLIMITGSDSFEFLQNLITCNLNELQQNEMTFGALLTPQGKVLFDFHVKRIKNNYLLDVSSQSRGDLIRHLDIYKLRSNVKISEENELDIFATWNPQEKATKAPDSRLSALGSRQYARDEEVESTAKLNDWHSFRISLGIPELNIDYGSQELFPHYAMMDQFETGGIDFTKGCYVGQEVVSRMEHRSTARQRFVIVKSETGFPDKGTEIMSIEGKKIGIMGGHVEKNGLALLHLERMKKCISDETNTIETQQEALKCIFPSYVKFDWT